MNVEIKISPKNLLEQWGNFEDWESGAAAAPTEFTKSGTGAAVAREATIVKRGTYSAKLTYGSADAQLYYDHPDYADYQGRKVKLGFWVYTAVASQARIKVDDGVGSSQSSYHTGGGGWELLTVERDIDAGATRLRVICFVDIAGAAYFDGGILCEGDILFTDLSDGSQFYIERLPVSKDIRQSEYKPSRRDGIILGKPRYGKQSIKLAGHVIGTDAATARTNLDTLLKALWTINESRVDESLKDIYFYDDRFLRGQVKNWSDNRYAAMRRIDFDFDFVVPDPFYQYINRTRLVQTISSTPTSFDCTPGGNVHTMPKVSFIADQGGDITSLTLENLTTGEAVTYSGTVSSGKTLVIDGSVRPRIVEDDGVDDLANHVGDFLQLLAMTNKLKYTGSLCTIKIDFFDRYL